MGVILSVPAKTFVAGEYLALAGGPCLLAATGPQFQLRVKDGDGIRDGLPAGSPADLFIQRHPDFFAKLDLSFVDPYLRAGGYGASTAQFLAVFALAAWGRSSLDESSRELDLKVLFEEYKTCAWNGQGVPPSGADLIGQLKGGFTWFERRAGMISRGLWPFTGAELFFIRTGEKVATHEHLRTLGDFDVSELEARMRELRAAWDTANESDFAEGLNGYGKALARLGFAAPRTLDLLHDLAWNSSVLAAKGCGALGADVVLALVRKNLVRSFQLWCEEKELTVSRVSEKLSEGLELKVESAVELGQGAFS